MRALLLVAAFFAVALAGCGDRSGTECKADDPACGVAPPEPGLGVIVCVVVDERIVPVPGAAVEVVGQDVRAATDAQGRCELRDVEPGPQVVRVAKAGFRTAQQSVEVVADATSPVVRLLLESDPDARPYFEVHTWQGFLECSAGVWDPRFEDGAAAINPCFVSEHSDNVRQEPLAGPATFVQSEMLWEGAGDVGASLQISAYVPDDGAADGADDFAGANGLSPLVVRVNETTLASKGVGTAHPYGLRVFPGGHAGDPATVFVQQEFTVYTHVFHNMVPPEGWAFSRDGDPPLG